MTTPIYLDYAAATPMDPRVLAAMAPYFTDHFYNPSATYLPAVAVRKDIEAARASVASLLGARPSEIIFTAGGTEANNLVLRGVMQQYPGSNLIVSAIEHESVLATAHQYDTQEVPVNAHGVTDAEALLGRINDKTVLASVMYANNEVGSVQPVHQIALALIEIRRARRLAGNELPLYLHTDAAQAAPYLDLHVARLGVDFMTLNAGKMYGPKQSGLLFAAAHTRFQPQISGGGQERGQRSGTENVPGIVGLAKALDLVVKHRRGETERLKKLQDIFFAGLAEMVPQAIINGSQKTRLPNNMHITIPGVDNERLLIQLEGKGILAAAGSACSASNEEPSHVLRAMGVSTADAQASLRFSMGRHTTEADIRYTLSALRTLT